MEHRWGRRTSCDIAVRLLADPASAGWGRIRDVSISGGFIETKLRAAPLSTLHLTRFVKTEHGAEAQVFRAIVIRRESDGLGVEWFDADADAVMTLMQDSRTDFASMPAPGGSAWFRN